MLLGRLELLQPRTDLLKTRLLNRKHGRINSTIGADEIRAVEAVAEQVRLEIGGVARGKRCGDRCLAPGVP